MGSVRRAAAHLVGMSSHPDTDHYLARREAERTAAAAHRAAKRATRLARTRRGVVVPTNAGIAVDRFRPEGPRGYLANNVPGSQVHATREQAETAWLDHHHPLPTGDAR